MQLLTFGGCLDPLGHILIPDTCGWKSWNSVSGWVHERFWLNKLGRMLTRTNLIRCPNLWAAQSADFWPWTWMPWVELGELHSYVSCKTISMCWSPAVSWLSHHSDPWHNHKTPGYGAILRITQFHFERNAMNLKWIAPRCLLENLAWEPVPCWSAALFQCTKCSEKKILSLVIFCVLCCSWYLTDLKSTRGCVRF